MATNSKMYKYLTMTFSEPTRDEIYSWLNFMSRPELPASEGRDVEVVGYAVCNGILYITVRKFEK